VLVLFSNEDDVSIVPCSVRLFFNEDDVIIVPCSPMFASVRTQDRGCALTAAGDRRLFSFLHYPTPVPTHRHLFLLFPLPSTTVFLVCGHHGHVSGREQPGKTMLSDHACLTMLADTSFIARQEPTLLDPIRQPPPSSTNDFTVDAVSSCHLVTTSLTLPTVLPLS